MGAMSDLFANARLIVVKVGSSLLVDGDSGAASARLAGILVRRCGGAASAQGARSHSGLVRLHRAGAPRC